MSTETSQEKKIKTIRKIEISNFKNLGIGETPFQIILNRSLDQECLGEVITLLGANGIGKSNVLSALSRVGKDLEADDLPYNIDNADTDNVSLLIKDQEFNENKKAKVITWKSDNLFKKPEIDFRNFKFDRSDLNNYAIEELKQLNDYSNQIKEILSNINSSNYVKFTNYDSLNDFLESEFALKTLNHLNLKTNKFIITFLDKGSDYLNFKYEKSVYWNDRKEIKEVINNAKTIMTKMEDIVTSVLEKNKLLFQKQKQEDIINQTTDEFGDQIPKIISYTDHKLKNTDFIQNYKEPLNELFKTVLQYCKIQQQNFVDTDFKLNKRNLEYKANRKLCKLNEQLNKIFNYKNQLLEFSLRFDSEEMILNFNLKNKEQVDDDSKQQFFPQKYSFQSTGQQWLINFFFNLIIKTNNLIPGNIVLIDEIPAILNPNSYSSLRNALRTFSRDFHLTILTTTQMPNWIDFDYLEDIRIIDQIDEAVYCENNFTVSQEKKFSDTCKQLSQKMMSSNNLIFQFPKAKIIFVEGITDYLYLTGIKIYLIQQNPNLTDQYEQIFFIPINGVGVSQEEQNKIWQEINCEYQNCNFHFLVDNDSNGKKWAENTNKNNVTKTFTLDKLTDEKIVVIEDLIDEADLNKFALKNKDINLVATFKKMIINGSAQEKTYTNLTKLFHQLIDNFK